MNPAIFFEDIQHRPAMGDSHVLDTPTVQEPALQPARGRVPDLRRDVLIGGEQPVAVWEDRRREDPAHPVADPPACGDVPDRAVPKDPPRQETILSREEPEVVGLEGIDPLQDLAGVGAPDGAHLHDAAGDDAVPVSEDPRAPHCVHMGELLQRSTGIEVPDDGKAVPAPREYAVAERKEPQPHDQGRVAVEPRAMAAGAKDNRRQVVSDRG
mmetsp:Transcript_16103/g.46584  ORF Transcript_16103/g.46584 Transcript_16103/m.46584 type:complete len:212 (-) Transcript_16103:285-920(-)